MSHKEVDGGNEHKQKDAHVAKTDHSALDDYRSPHNAKTQDNQHSASVKAHESHPHMHTVIEEVVPRQRILGGILVTMRQVEDEPPAKKPAKRFVYEKGHEHKKI